MESQLTRDKTPPDRTPNRWRRTLVRAGFLVSALSLLVFLGVAVMILWQLPLIQLDSSVALYLQQHSTRLGMRAMRLVSGLADPGVPLIGVVG
ncbi:MAG: hypothetical protein ABIV47_26120, partial [Roseiflexaceae bacterium]